MKQRTFTIDWPLGHETRDGRKARIICTDRRGYQGASIVVLTDNDNDTGERMQCVQPNGFYNNDGVTENRHDLVDILPAEESAPEPAAFENEDEDDFF